MPNPILKEFPHGFLTERLLIRIPLKVLYNAIQASKEELSLM
ncbi:hypothetical protein ACFQ3N_07935 [Virgibacillus byunsanensis]|uniref:Uncharacterized protein n=1 Tax=Virgibacillus byunsanensis TaxID=570945 RepID=A0ABW3LLN9_9BACI